MLLVKWFRPSFWLDNPKWHGRHITWAGLGSCAALAFSWLSASFERTARWWLFVVCISKCVGDVLVIRSLRCLFQKLVGYILVIQSFWCLFQKLVGTVMCSFVIVYLIKCNDRTWGGTNNLRQPVSSLNPQHRRYEHVQRVERVHGILGGFYYGLRKFPSPKIGFMRTETSQSRLTLCHLSLRYVLFEMQAMRAGKKPIFTLFTFLSARHNKAKNSGDRRWNRVANQKREPDRKKEANSAD